MKTDHIYPVKGDRMICRKNNWNSEGGNILDIFEHELLLYIEAASRILYSD